MNRASLGALWVAQTALENFTPEERSPMGLILGTALGCSSANESFHFDLVRDGPQSASPSLFAQTIASGPVGEISIALGVRGPSTVVMAGRCSAVAAVMSARRMLATHRTDRVLVIASDTLGEGYDWVRKSRGELPAAEATIAVVLEAHREPSLPRSTLATLTAARWNTHDANDTNDTNVDWLGVTALVTLPRWLDGQTPRHTVTVRDETLSATLEWTR